jgi:hypothetical protein
MALVQLCKVERNNTSPIYLVRYGNDDKAIDNAILDVILPAENALCHVEDSLNSGVKRKGVGGKMISIKKKETAWKLSLCQLSIDVTLEDRILGVRDVNIKRLGEYPSQQSQNDFGI